MLGAWLAAEQFTAHDLGAMAVILLGVVAITLGKARAARAPTEPSRRADQPRSRRHDRRAPIDRRGLWVAAGLVRALGADAAVLAPAQGRAVAADRGAPHRVERAAGRRLAVPGRRAATGCATALARPRVAWMLALSGAADRLQLGPVHLGGQRRPCGRNQPGLLHQSAAQRGAGRAVPARTPDRGAVGVGGDRRGRRVVADLQLRQLSVDRAVAGGFVRACTD